jgi:hypothetical protein
MTTGHADSVPGRSSARGNRVRTAAGLVAGAVLVLALALAAAISGSFFGASDDLALSLPRSADARLVERRIVAAPGRTVEHVVVSDPVLGSIGFALSLPDPLPARKLPLVVILGGLGTGEHNLSAIESPGPNAVAAYDWPLPTALPRGLPLKGAGAADRRVTWGLLRKSTGQAAAVYARVCPSPRTRYLNVQSCSMPTGPRA